MLSPPRALLWLSTGLEVDSKSLSQSINDVQLQLVTSVDKTSAGLSVLAACSFAHLMSDSGTYKTACSSSRTSPRLWL